MIFGWAREANVSKHPQSPQLRILGFGLFEDEDFGVAVLPARELLKVGSSLRRFSRDGVSAPGQGAPEQKTAKGSPQLDAVEIAAAILAGVGVNGRVDG